MANEKIKVAFKNVINSDKQRLATYLAYVAIIGISIFSSCLNVIFGTENFDQTRFITNLCFNVAIAILGLVLAWKDGELSNETRKSGQLYEARKMFDKIVKIIVDSDAFRQWADIFYEVKRKEYIMNLLSTFGIYDYDYLLISEKDLETLKHEPLENIVYRYKGQEYKVCLDEITETQYYQLLKLRKNPIKYERLPFTFFLSRKLVDEYQKYAKEQESNKKQKVLALAYRVGSLVILSAIIALSIINPTKSSASQVAFDTIGRIFQLCTSLFMGYTIAHDEGKREIACLEYKASVIELYDNDCQNGIFVPKNRSEVIAEKIATLREKKIRENGIDFSILQNDKVKEVEVVMTPEQYDNFVASKEN